MNLNDLITDLEKQAGMAEDKSSDKEKDAKAKADAKKAEDEAKKDGRSEKEKEDDAALGEQNGQEKSAAFQSGSELAKEIMTKVASATITNTKGEEMNKSASDAGKALAQALMQKLAATGDTNTVNGIPEGVVPNKTQVDLAAQVAEHDAIIQPTPMGMVPGKPAGTLNQIFDAIIADAQGQGVVSSVIQTPVAPAEGAPNARQTPNQEDVESFVGAEGEGQEKAAAVSALVNEGWEFDDAVALVKQASDELEAEEDALIKQAAFNELMAQGYGFEDAVHLVKSAGAFQAAAKAVGGSNRVIRKGAVMAEKATRAVGAGAARATDAAKSAAGYAKANPGRVAAGAAGAAVGAGAAAAAMGREKKAAVDQLMAYGVDFDSAVEAVNAKAAEIYGV